ncbi:tyrosine-protein phosphatase [Lacrimispora sp.]|jgi:protein-tyrosine phosphatase|uniref:tyrosine-protein phosphatase n=1 Tax=Lacrimispora sp. TaxID=2719234 RepID=UPI00289670C8|nr:tyrosine-protein phosphatase [Lacrimispora sp.]
MEIKYIEAFPLDNGKTELNIVSDGETLEEYHLYWTYEKDPFTKNRSFLLSSREKRLTFHAAPEKRKPIYFITEWKDQAPMLFGYRILPVDGMYNLRDMGGYITESGRRIKWGVGYRSDYFAFLEDSGLEYVKNLGIKTIIDYRNEEEIKRSPNRNLGDGVTTYFCDPNAHTAMVAGLLHNNENLTRNEAIVKQAKIAVEEKPNAGDLRMIQQQLNFVMSDESRKAFGNSLRILARRSNNPSVQHCRGGKDRTGFGAMILQGILGVPKDLMIHDYMLTKRARAEKNVRYYQRYLELAKDERVADYLFSLFDTKPEYIEASIDKILEDFGSVREYAKAALSLDDSMISQLEDIFLE